MILLDRGRRRDGKEPEPRTERGRGSRGTQLHFLAAMESSLLSEDLRRLLEGLLGRAELEILPEDGPLVLARMQAVRPTLAFVPMVMRRMEGLTFLRALPPARARQVVLMVPDTLEGYRVAWDALCLGARDFLATRGVPAQRFKGSVGQRLRQLAHLLHADEGGRKPDIPFPAGEEFRASPGRQAAARTPNPQTPWLVLSDTRNLVAVAGWLRSLPAEAPVVVRIPEGPRFLRVAQEGIGRAVAWPVRTLLSGDRLVPGHVHLFSDSDTIRIQRSGDHTGVSLEPAAHPPGSWGAYHHLLERARSSNVPLRVLLSGPDGPEEEIYLSENRELEHTVYYLERIQRDASAEDPDITAASFGLSEGNLRAV